MNSTNSQHFLIVIKRKCLHLSIATSLVKHFRYYFFFPLHMENGKFKYCSAYVLAKLLNSKHPQVQPVLHSSVPWGVPVSCVFHFKFCLLEFCFLSFGFHQGQRNLSQIKNVNIQSSTGNVPIQTLNNKLIGSRSSSTYTKWSTAKTFIWALLHS